MSQTADMRLEVSIPKKVREAVRQTRVKNRQHNEVNGNLAIVSKTLLLSDNQTRFLISEFARQPSPDNAHLARLAREIPSSTVEQIQEWFSTQ
jgi:hypothetical protein